MIVYNKNCSKPEDCTTLKNSICATLNTTETSNTTSNTADTMVNVSKTICRCKTGFYYNTQNISCDKVIDKKCQDEETRLSCLRVGNANCKKNESCKCEHGFVKGDGGISCETVYKKRNCSDDTSCSKLQHSVCVKPARTTVAMTSIASTESSSSQIIYGKCECDSGYYYNNSQFACQKVLRNACGVSDGANTCSDVQHAICAENKTCVCGPGFEINTENTSCNEVHNSSCTPQNQHSGCLFLPNSICTTETKNSGSAHMTVPYPTTSTLFSSPSTTTTKTTRTAAATTPSQQSDETKSNKCLCQHGYYYMQRNRTHAACEPVLGRFCDDAHECSGITNAVCTKGLNSTAPLRCYCAHGFDSNKELTCFEVYKKRNCSDDTSCSKLQHSVCVKPARTTVAMTSIASTESSSSQIIYGKCECDSGYYYNNSQFACQKVLRNACGVSDGANTCSDVQHAICAENKTCVCGPGFEINTQNTSCNEVHNSSCTPQNQHSGCLFLPNSICTTETKKQWVPHI
ncbi:platelet endothelial aggregation receptor 1-like [Ruditapes philippinarum]|uniref:platelet endothelial aggregation receptor 1-like n=1 Tax=Ruditapes philippinarum TaxID=129788 RepID=UPI00295BC6F7|nr:platelet endothelial aggregation receptor 1-like [Ruditapes philippinarum]